MFNINRQTQPLVDKFIQFKSNALRSIDGVLKGIELSKKLLSKYVGRDPIIELDAIRSALHETYSCIRSFTIDISPDGNNKISIIHSFTVCIENCSEIEFIYRLTNYEREVAICFENLKTISPDHKELCTSAQETLHEIVKDFSTALIEDFVESY